MNSFVEDGSCVKSLLTKINQSGGKISAIKLHAFARKSVFATGEEHVKVRKTIELISWLRKRRLVKQSYNVVEITPKGMRILSELNRTR